MAGNSKDTKAFEATGSLVDWKKAMEYVINREEKIHEEGSGQVDRINAAIRQLGEERDRVNKSEGILRYWKLQHSALSTSRWVKELKWNELEKEEARRRATVSERISLDHVKQEELRELRSRKEQQWSEQCANFHAICKEYGLKFLKAQLEYVRYKNKC